MEIVKMLVPQSKYSIKCPYRTLQEGWQRFLDMVKSYMINKPIDNNIESGSDEPVRVYQNGSTSENVYANTDCTIKIGSLIIFGIILGHKSNNMKIIKSILFGFISYMIPSGLTLGGIFLIGLFNPEVMDLFNNITGFTTEAIKTVLFCGIAMYAAYIVTYYILGKKILEKGVNVD